MRHRHYGSSPSNDHQVGNSRVFLCFLKEERDPDSAPIVRNVGSQFTERVSNCRFVILVPRRIAVRSFTSGASPGFNLVGFASADRCVLGEPRGGLLSPPARPILKISDLRNPQRLAEFSRIHRRIPETLPRVHIIPSALETNPGFIALLLRHPEVFPLFQRREGKKERGRTTGSAPSEDTRRSPLEAPHFFAYSSGDISR